MSAPYVIEKLDEFDKFKKDIEDGTTELPAGKKELQFSTYQNFPAIGESGVLYIDTEKKTMYFFDTDSLTYTALKSASSAGETTGDTSLDKCFLEGDTLQCVL